MTSTKRKLAVILATLCLVMAMATCFAAETGTQAGFISALTTGINADTMWGAVTPVTPLIIFTFIFAFAFLIIKRVLKKGSKGRFGM